MNSDLVYRLGKRHTWGGPKTFLENFERYLGCQINEIKLYRHLWVATDKKIIIINGNSRIVAQFIFYFLLRSTVIMRVGAFVDSDQISNNSMKSRFRLLKRQILMHINISLSHKLIFQSEYSRKRHEQNLLLRSIISRKSVKVIHNPCFEINTSTVENTTNKLICVEGAFGETVHNDLLKAFANFACIDAVGVHRGERIEGVNYIGKKTHSEVLNLYKQRPLAFLCLEQNANCPNSVIEALCHGIPVIGMNNGSLKELIDDGGILFNGPISDEKAEKIMLDIMANNKDFSTRAIQSSKKFSVDKTLSEYMKFIHD